MPRFKQQNPRHIVGSLLDTNRDETAPSLDGFEIEEDQKSPEFNMHIQQELDENCSGSECDSSPLPDSRKDIENHKEDDTRSSKAICETGQALDDNSNKVRDNMQSTTTENELSESEIVFPRKEAKKNSLSSTEFYRQALAGDLAQSEQYSRAISQMWNNFLAQCMNKMNTNGINKNGELLNKVNVEKDANNNQTDDRCYDAAIEKTAAEKSETKHDENTDLNKHKNSINPYSMYRNSNMLNAWKEYFRYREVYLNSAKQADVYGHTFPLSSNPPMQGNVANWMNPNFQGYVNPEYASSLIQSPLYNNQLYTDEIYADVNKAKISHAPESKRSPIFGQHSPPPKPHTDGENISSFMPTAPHFASPYSFNPDYRRNFNEYDVSADTTINGKVRKSKSRPSAVHSIGDAIVREAKQQLKGVDPENMYIPCPICHKRIKRLYHFQRHMRIHSGEKSHHCPYCPYKSVRKDNLKSHMKTHQKHTLNDPKRPKYPTQQSSPLPSKDSAPVRHSMDFPMGSNNMSFLEYSPKHGMFSLSQANNPQKSRSPINYPPLSSTVAPSPNSATNNIAIASPLSVPALPYHPVPLATNSPTSFDIEKSPKRKLPSTPESVIPGKFTKIGDTDQFQQEKINDNNSNNTPEPATWTSRENSQVESKLNETIRSPELVQSDESQNLTPSNMEESSNNSFFNNEKDKEDSKNQFLFSSNENPKSPENCLTRINPDSPKSLPIRMGKHELKCRVCSFSTTDMSSLQDHMQSHKTRGYYKCNECNYHGKNLSKLIEHNRIHTGERPFQCDQCSYAAKRKDNLAQHKNVKHKMPFLSSNKHADNSLNGLNSNSKLNGISQHFPTSSSGYKGYPYPSFPSSLLTSGKTTEIKSKLDPENEININFSLSVSGPKYSWKSEKKCEKDSIVKSERKSPREPYEPSSTKKRKMTPPPSIPKSSKPYPDIGYLSHNQPMYSCYPYFPQQQAMYPLFNLQQSAMDMTNVLGYHQHNFMQANNMFHQRNVQSNLRCSVEKHDSKKENLCVRPTG